MWFIKNSRPRSLNFLPDHSNRLELARRLHDGLAQNLAALGYQLDELVGDSQTSPAIKSELRKIRLDLINVINDFRDDIYLLRTLSFTHLEEELKGLLANIACQIDLPIGLLSSQAEDALSKAILEIARNSAEHSNCRLFRIYYELPEGSRVLIHISDNGSGIVQIREGSFGLLTIAEEVSRAGAQIQQTSDSTGTHYVIEIGIK